MRTILRIGMLSLMYGVTSATVIIVFLVRPGLDGHPHASFPDVVRGTAYKPYVYRALVPAGVRLISMATPDGLEEAVDRDFASKRIAKVLGWQTDYIYEYLSALALMVLSLIGYAFSLRALFRNSYDYSPVSTDLIPIGGLLVLPLLFRYYSYIYDPSNLFLFTLAMALIVTGRTAWFYVVFTLATVNKETSFLLIGLFLAYRLRGSLDRATVVHAGLLSLIWFAIKGGLAYAYLDHPGSFVEMHLLDHNLRVPFEHPVSLAYFVGVYVLFGWLIGTGWAAKPEFLKRGLLITVPVLLVLHFFFGYIDELRGYYEALPCAYLLSVPTVAKILAYSGSG
jgi:hypothetical protein